MIYYYQVLRNGPVFKKLSLVTNKIQVEFASIV